MEGMSFTAYVIALALVLVVCIAQVLARVFTTIDPSAAF